MNVVVTGGEGFLGKWVVQALQATGVQAVPFGRSQGDLYDFANAQRAVAGADTVIHLAALVGGVGFLKENQTRVFYQNLTMGSNIVHACATSDVGRLVIVGTSCSYPTASPMPLREERFFKGLPDGDTGSYGLAKAAVTHLANELLPQRSTDVVTLVPTNLYGPRDTFDPQRSHVVPALIRKAFLCIGSNGPEMQVWGTGRATRDLLYIEDAAAAIARAAVHPQPFYGEIINLASGRETTIRELAQTVAAAVDPQIHLSFRPEKPGGVQRRVMSIALAADRLGFRPEVSLDEGIRRTVAWVRSSGLVEHWTREVRMAA